MITTNYRTLAERLAPPEDMEGYAGISSENMIRQILNDFLDTPVCDFFGATKQNHNHMQLKLLLHYNRKDDDTFEDMTMKDYLEEVETRMNHLGTPEERLGAYTRFTHAFYVRLRQGRVPEATQIMDINYQVFRLYTDPVSRVMDDAAFSRLFSEAIEIGDDRLFCAAAPFQLQIENHLDSLYWDTETRLEDLIRTPFSNKYYSPFNGFSYDKSVDYFGDRQANWITLYFGFWNPLYRYATEQQKGGSDEKDITDQ